MPISNRALHAILGTATDTPLEPNQMAKGLKVTFFPYAKGDVNDETLAFVEELKRALEELGIEILPYEKVQSKFGKKKWIKWYTLASLNTLKGRVLRLFGVKYDTKGQDLKTLKFIRKGERIKKGIVIIAVGESETGRLPMDFTMSFRETSIVTIIDMPKHIKKNTNFLTHFDTAMDLFAHHMTNIVIAVSKDKWLTYNFNAAHPIYSRKEDMKPHLLSGLIPKLTAPIQPPRLKEFTIREQMFDANDEEHKPFVDDLINASRLLEKAKIYPPGKSIHDLPWRNEFYNWVGRIHLDERTGMSYGFLARQLPVEAPDLISYRKAKRKFSELRDDRDFFYHDNNLYLIVELADGRHAIKVPEVWVLTQRSGSDKTQFDPNKDLIKMGLKNGELFLETPMGLSFKQGYRPSFDTRVILAHAVGNALVAGILKHLDSKNTFVKQLESNGMAIAHWHGYLKQGSIPKNWHVHGPDKPHVACSTPQSAVYALEGKLSALILALHSQQEYLRDIHIEPHHGTNAIMPTLQEFAEFISENPGVTELGNRFLGDYFKRD